MDTASKNRYLHFYPRSPCGERLYCHCWHLLLQKISIHALLAESDPTTTHISTLMLYFYPRSPCGERLLDVQPKDENTLDFYPRSPCGERLHFATLKFVNPYISIHALLAESDITDIDFRIIAKISIHALLAESDTNPRSRLRPLCNFYPRSPCGERPKIPEKGLGPVNFYPRSPCGERQGWL